MDFISRSLFSMCLLWMGFLCCILCNSW